MKKIYRVKCIDLIANLLCVGRANRYLVLEVGFSYVAKEVKSVDETFDLIHQRLEHKHNVSTTKKRVMIEFSYLV